MSDDVGNEETELEKEFKALHNSVVDKINAKLEKAALALQEAVELSEKHGLPFYSNICPVGNSYIPESFGESKFAELEQDYIEDITGVYDEYGDFSYGGWVHSAIC